VSTNIRTWYDLVLQQMAAESYLEKIGVGSNTAVSVLMFGNNHPLFQQPDEGPTTDLLVPRTGSDQCNMLI
jgi:hypothetical protein